MGNCSLVIRLKQSRDAIHASKYAGSLQFCRHAATKTAVDDCTSFYLSIDALIQSTDVRLPSFTISTARFLSFSIDFWRTTSNASPIELSATSTEFPGLSPINASFLGRSRSAITLTVIESNGSFSSDSFPGNEWDNAS